MESRVKEQQLGLFADRTEHGDVAGKQLRLWIASLAHSLLRRCAAWAWPARRWQGPQVGTIRVRLLELSGPGEDQRASRPLQRTPLPSVPGWTPRNPVSAPTVS